MSEAMLEGFHKAFPNPHGEDDGDYINPCWEEGCKWQLEQLLELLNDKLICGSNENDYSVGKTDGIEESRDVVQNLIEEIK